MSANRTSVDGVNELPVHCLKCSGYNIDQSILAGQTGLQTDSRKTVLIVTRFQMQFFRNSTQKETWISYICKKKLPKTTSKLLLVGQWFTIIKTTCSSGNLPTRCKKYCMSDMPITVNHCNKQYKTTCYE